MAVIKGGIYAPDKTIEKVTLSPYTSGWSRIMHKPRKPLEDGYAGYLYVDVRVTPNKNDFDWTNAGTWNGVEKTKAIRLFTISYMMDGQQQVDDVCFVVFENGAVYPEINTTLTNGGTCIAMGILPIWADSYVQAALPVVLNYTKRWYNYWVSTINMYANYGQLPVHGTITNIEHQDIWGNYITGEWLWKNTRETDGSPYDDTLRVQLSSTPAEDSEISLLCDSAKKEDIDLCARCGLTVGEVRGKELSIYVVDKPYRALTLFVEYSKQE